MGRTCKFLFPAVFCALFIFASCVPAFKVTYNEITEVTSPAAPYIEGAYSDSIDTAKHEELTGLKIAEGLPEKYRDAEISHGIAYEKDGRILNITTYIGTDPDKSDYTLVVSLDSKEIWSPRSYSTADYVYGDTNTNTLVKTVISGTDVAFLHYSDEKAEYKLGHDVYIAKFAVNKINVYVECTDDSVKKAEFENYVASIIGSAKQK
jgi:hypothetical protein